jgi:hypothetical protein
VFFRKELFNRSLRNSLACVLSECQLGFEKCGKSSISSSSNRTFYRFLGLSAIHHLYKIRCGREANGHSSIFRVLGEFLFGLWQMSRSENHRNVKCETEFAFLLGLNSKEDAYLRGSFPSINYEKPNALFDIFATNRGSLVLNLMSTLFPSICLTLTMFCVFRNVYPSSSMMFDLEDFNFIDGKIQCPRKELRRGFHSVIGERTPQVSVASPT